MIPPTPSRPETLPWLTDPVIHDIPEPPASPPDPIPGLSRSALRLPLISPVLVHPAIWRVSAVPTIPPAPEKSEDTVELLVQSLIITDEYIPAPPVIPPMFMPPVSSLPSDSHPARRVLECISVPPRIPPTAAEVDGPLIEHSLTEQLVNVPCPRLPPRMSPRLRPRPRRQTVR